MFPFLCLIVSLYAPPNNILSLYIVLAQQKHFLSWAASMNMNEKEQAANNIFNFFHICSPAEKVCIKLCVLNWVIIVWSQF